MGLVNSVIYLGEIGTYPGYALLLVALGIGALVYGVCMLSESKEAPVVGTNEFDFEDEDESKSENIGKWDSISVGGSSSAAGSDVGLCNQDSSSARGRFGDGRIFSFSRKSGPSSKPGFFRMNKLSSKNRTEFREVDTKSSQIRLENSSIPHIIIDQDEECSDDEFVTQTMVPVTTSPETITDDLLLFSQNSSSQQSATKSDDESLSSLILKNQLLNKAYEDEAVSVIYARSFDDLLETKNSSREGNDKPNGERS
ncbi:3385_t:CDS:1 [Acaulospora colombiana]|uniref:3385_t:CDS:1 n=1 Tax=Acaulospora colombiana TaxID=27376 RepID=A0ACA9LYS2_9GLOM|nr:3385_t:CDS:1 [Acaulospora colombiana]